MVSLIIGLIVLTALLRVWLELRQHACLRRQLSASLPAWTDAASMQRAIRGALRKVKIAILAVLAETALAVFFVVEGPESIARAHPIASMPASAGAVMLSALFLLSMGAVRRAADAANVFIVDAAIGLGRPGTLRFLSDTLMRLIVTSIVNLPLLIAAALLMESRSPMWWLAAWAIWLMLVMLDLALRPLVQTRLLYTATRLHNESLAAQIAHLLMRCGLRLASVQVLDASSRTRRANASVHGLGRQKHIYLHDTLLERLRPNEILAVVAHEAGHARHRHVLQHLAVLAMLGFAAAAGASVLLERLGATTAEQLAMIVLLTPSLGFLARPIMFKLSRRFEYEADAFSAAHVGAPAMAHALERLYVANAGVPESDPLYAAFHASHPGPRERLGRLDDRGGGR